MTTETDLKEVVGVDAPTHRVNMDHPLTGRPDSARQSIGDRRRIEQLEFENGRVICGFRSRKDAHYCTDPPETNQHRCRAHMSAYAERIRPLPGGTRYSPMAHKFNRCARCGIKPCEGRVDGGQADDCVYEVEQFEILLADAATLATYGPTTQHLFAELIWTFVVIGRLERQVASEGMTVVHIDGAINANGEVQFIKNDNEHPILKHLAKLQQSAKQLATELELTPRSRTGKSADDADTDFKRRLGDLWKESVRAYADAKSTKSQGD